MLLLALQSRCPVSVRSTCACVNYSCPIPHLTTQAVQVYVARCAQHAVLLLRHILWVVLFVGCLTSQQHATLSQGRICSDNFTCCHIEIEVADPTFYITQSQYTDTGPTSPSIDPITPGAWQGSHWSGKFSVTGMTRPPPPPTPPPQKKSRRKRDSNSGSSALEADALTTRPTRRYSGGSHEFANHPPSTADNCCHLNLKTTAEQF